MARMTKNKDDDGLLVAPGVADTLLPERQIMVERYGSVMEYKKRTRVPLSMETCRRFFYEDMPVSATTYIILLKYLGLEAKEIKERLIAGVSNGRITDTPHERTIAKDLAQLLSDSAANLTIRDRAIVKIHRRLSKHKEANSACLDFFGGDQQGVQLEP